MSMQQLPEGPPPEPALQPARGQPAAGGGRSWISPLLAAAVGALALGAVATGWVHIPGFGSGTPSAPVIETVAPASTHKLFQPVAAAEIERAIATLAMSDQDRSRVRTAVNGGKARLGWVTVSDAMNEDGDWVAVTGAGFRQDVRLSKRPLLVAVPYAPGTPVTITGLVDGQGGGITLSVHLGGGIVNLKPLQRGESLEVPAE
jgi:hypothetical protein